MPGARSTPSISSLEIFPNFDFRRSLLTVAIRSGPGPCLPRFAEEFDRRFTRIDPGNIARDRDHLDAVRISARCVVANYYRGPRLPNFATQRGIEIDPPNFTAEHPADPLRYLQLRPRTIPAPRVHAPYREPSRDMPCPVTRPGAFSPDREAIGRCAGYPPAASGRWLPRFLPTRSCSEFTKGRAVAWMRSSE